MNTNPPNECPFCKILRGEWSSSEIYRDEYVMAFMDIHPISAGHLLVIPTQHCERLEDLSLLHGEKMFSTAMKITKVLKDSDLDITGFNLHLSNGEVAGQEVPHVHLHLVPRRPGDGISWTRKIKLPPPHRKELDEISQKIKSRFQTYF